MRFIGPDGLVRNTNGPDGETVIERRPNMVPLAPHVVARLHGVPVAGVMAVLDTADGWPPDGVQLDAPVVERDPYLIDEETAEVCRQMPYIRGPERWPPNRVPLAPGIAARLQALHICTVDTTDGTAVVGMQFDGLDAPAGAPAPVQGWGGAPVVWRDAPHNPLAHAPIQLPADQRRAALIATWGIATLPGLCDANRAVARPLLANDPTGKGIVLVRVDRVADQAMAAINYRLADCARGFAAMAAATTHAQADRQKHIATYRAAITRYAAMHGVPKPLFTGMADMRRAVVQAADQARDNPNGLGDDTEYRLETMLRALQLQQALYAGTTAVDNELGMPVNLAAQPRVQPFPLARFLANALHGDAPPADIEYAAGRIGALRAVYRNHDHHDHHYPAHAVRPFRPPIMPYIGNPNPVAIRLPAHMGYGYVVPHGHLPPDPRAEEVAAAKLVAHLDDQQRLTWHYAGYADITGSQGGHYRVWHPQKRANSYNVDRLKDDEYEYTYIQLIDNHGYGEALAEALTSDWDDPPVSTHTRQIKRRVADGETFCAYAIDDGSGNALPLGDQVLARILCIECNEPHFLATANWGMGGAGGVNPWAGMRQMPRRDGVAQVQWNLGRAHNDD